MFYCLYITILSILGGQQWKGRDVVEGWGSLHPWMLWRGGVPHIHSYFLKTALSGVLDMYYYYLLLFLEDQQHDGSAMPQQLEMRMS